MAITLNGTTGITTPAVTNNGAYTGDGVSFADNTPSNTLVTDTSGNVLVGTTSADGKLSIGGATTGIIYQSTKNTGGNLFLGIESSAGGGLISGGSAYASQIFTQGATALQFGTNNNVRATIDSSGKLLVGATSSFGGKLQSTGVAGVSSAASFKPGQNGDGTLEWFNASNGYVGAVTVNASTVVYGGTSDYRLKDNVAPMTGALAKISALKPVTYTWKIDGEAGEGFIAHELQQVCPSAVVGEKDAINEDGSIKPQQIDTSFLVATLTAAIQELKAELDTVKTELATLKGTV